MATRSTIAYRTPEGRIVAVYCHWDGYPSNNGRILQENYQQALKIAQLISLGDISSLGREIGVKHAFSRLDTDMTSEEFEAKYGEMTTFYGRDRGETGTEPRVFNDIPEWVREMAHSGAEYSYLWNGTEWLVNSYQRTSAGGFPEFDRVEDVLEMDDA